MITEEDVNSLLTAEVTDTHTHKNGSLGLHRWCAVTRYYTITRVSELCYLHHSVSTTPSLKIRGLILMRSREYE